MSLRKVALSIWVVTLAAVSLASPASAQVTTDAATPAPAASITVTVPVFGTSMIITIVTDQGGGFVSADITPTAPAAPVTVPASGSGTNSGQTKATGVFEIKFDNSAPNAVVTIKINDGSAPGTTGGASPAANPGATQWVGDPLGNGDIVVVGYTVGADAAGAPTIKINSINGAAPAATTVVASAGKVTWYQILSPTDNGGRLVQFITFFDAPADASTQVSTNLTFVITSVGGQNKVSVSLTDPSAASTINGTAKKSRGEREGEGREGRDNEGERGD